MNAVGYVRVSTSEQAENGYGLDVQRQAIARYCEAQGLTLLDVYADAGISGTNDLDRRPGLAAALAAMESGTASRLVVYRLDRLARDLVLQELLLARLTRRGAALVSVSEPDLDTLSDDPTKVLIRQVLGALGQYERAVIRGRMSAGRAVKAARGGYVGGAPRYGHEATGGELAVSSTEQAVVRLVRELRSQGRSYRSICDGLAAAGYKPRRGVHWQPSVVRDIALRTSA